MPYCKLVIVASCLVACGTPSPSSSREPVAATEPDAVDDDGDDADTSGGVDASTGGEATSSGEGSSSGVADESTSGDATSSTTRDDAELDPPAGGSSDGSGGPIGAGVLVTTPSGYAYRVIHPGGTGPFELLLVFSGVEGGQTMTNNLLSVETYTNTGHMLRAVVDGAQYNLDQQVGADVLDDVRALYDIDNDRTYVLSESAGTVSGLATALITRQSYVAAFWANDINATADPDRAADELGFAPYGNCGPGGQFAGCDAIVGAMQTAGYRTPAPAPYDGPGASTHGDPNQFVAAVSWFAGKTRQ